MNVKLILALALLASMVGAFSPPPADDALVSLCESSGGTVNVTVYDPSTPQDGGGSHIVVRDAAVQTRTSCTCPEGFRWDSLEGCVKLDLMARIKTLIHTILSWFK